MSKPKLTRPLAAAVLCAAALWSGPLHALTLMEAYDLALRNDPSYRAARFERDAGRENRILGRSNLLPSLSASYGASHVRADVDYGVNPLTGRDNVTHPVYISRSAAVQLRQPLFSLDAWARYKQGIAQANYAESNFDARTQEAVVRIISAYVEALFAQEQLDLAKAAHDVLVEQRKVNDRLFEKGEGTKTDMLETQARLDVAEAQVLESEDNLRTARNTLAGLIGTTVDRLEGFSEQFRTQGLSPASFDAWRDLALKNNPELAAARFGIEASRQEIAKNRAGHAPRVDLVASYSKGDNESLNTYSQETTQRAIGVQVNIPLYSGGAVSAATRQAAANYERARAEYDARQDKVLVDLRREFNGVLTSRAKVAALEKAVESGRLLVTATEQSIKGGVRINLDLLNAQQQLYTSQRDLAQARFTYVLSSLRLRSGAGVLGRDDVQQIASNFR